MNLETLKNSVSFVNHELSCLGYTAPLADLDVESQPQVVSCITHCFFSLIQQRQKDMACIDELKEKLRQTNVDNDRLESSLSLYRGKLDQAIREADNVHAQLQMTKENLDSANSKLSNAKEELKSLKANNVYAKNLSSVEFRKLTREHERLKEKLVKATQDKYAVAKIGLEMNAPASPSTVGLLTSKKNQEGSMYKVILADAEKRERGLLSENESLRQCLINLYHCISDSEALKPIFESHFQLPFNGELKDIIEERMGSAIAHLDVRQIAGEKMELEEELSELRSKLCSLAEVVESQNQLIQTSLKGKQSGASENGGPSSDQMKTKLAEGLADLERQRKSFTDAAIKLGVERAALQKEKEQLERTKHQTHTRQLLSDLPSTPGWLSKDEPARSGDATPFNPSIVASNTATTTPSLFPSRNEIVIESDTFIHSPFSSSQRWNTVSTPTPLMAGKPRTIKSALKSANSSTASGSLLKNVRIASLSLQEETAGGENKEN